MKYICPICGKFYNKPADLAACVQKCANEVDNKEKRATALYGEITKTYTTLKNLINEYNTLNTGKIYTSTLKTESNKIDLSSSSNPKYSFKWTASPDSVNLWNNDGKNNFKVNSESENFLKDSKIDYSDFADSLSDILMTMLGGSNET